MSIGAVESGDTEKLNPGSAKSGEMKESVDEKSAATGDIYNVKGDHQALGHPVKQKSGWGIVLVIVLIIILCAGLGAAAYFILGIGV